MSPGIERLFNTMELNEQIRNSLISMNLCSIKSMIQLSNLDLSDVIAFFSRKDLQDSDFQETIMKVLCLGKCFQLLIKERSGLSKDEELPSHLIPTTLKEETSILEDEGILMLKQVYFSSYWQLRKNFLDLVEDLLSQDSLIGSTISTKSRGKDISCASKISSPSMMSYDTKSSKVSK